MLLLNMKILKDSIIQHFNNILITQSQSLIKENGIIEFKIIIIQIKQTTFQDNFDSRKAPWIDLAKI